MYPALFQKKDSKFFLFMFVKLKKKKISIQMAVKVTMHANARDARREFKKDAHRRTRSVPFALDLRDDSGDDKA